MTSDRDDDPSEALLRDLVAQVLDGLEDEGPLVVERICRDHPGAAAQVRRRLATLASAGLLDVDLPTPDFPERLGEYRLLERLGGGGMGVVYLARQEGLGRVVALKLVRPENLYFPDARVRFAREVEAVAKLSHPGIVPVYAAGEEQGVPFLAMEHVRGATLGELLADLRGRDPRVLRGSDLARALSERVGADDAERDAIVAREVFVGVWTEVCLRLVVQAARALQHAHERGVLHRDVKPSNLILASDGRLLLLDFGLALSRESARITRTGTELGSAPYAPPEQIKGRFAEVDERADVYALGVTFYELLTLHLPFLGADVDETRALILAGRPPEPRVLNPAMSRDVETLCLVAISPERLRRYASSAAFADDAQRALERRPLAVRRPGALSHARRWVERHVAATIALALASVLVVGGPLAWGLQQRGAAERLAEERDRSERHLESAREAVRTMLIEVGSADLADIREMEPVRRRLLERALLFEEGFLAERSGDPHLQREYAAALTAAAHLRLGLGDAEGAVSAFDEAARTRRVLLGDDPDDALLRDELAEDLLGVFSASSSTGRRALGELDEALVLRRALVASAPEERGYVLDLERSLSVAATDAVGHGDAPAAESYAREALAVHRDGDTSVDAAVSLASGWSNLGQSLAAQGRPGDAADATLHAVETVRAALEDVTATSSAEVAFALMLLNAGTLLRDLQRVDESSACSAAAMERLEDVVGRYPARIQPRSLLATAHSNHSLTLSLLGQDDEALEHASAAAELLRELAREAPEMTSWTANLGATLVNRASILRNLGRLDDARTDLLEGLDAVRAARARDTTQSEWIGYERNTRWFLVLALLDLDDVDAALEQARALATIDAEDPEDALLAAELVLRCADAADAAGSRAVDTARWRIEALALLREAVRRGLDDPDVLRGDVFAALSEDPATALGWRDLVEALAASP